MDTYGLWSLIPPVVAIGFAFAMREIIISLSAGILAGGIIYVIGSHRSVLDIPVVLLDVASRHVSDNVYMVIFLLMLGALVSVISAAGGAHAYGEWARQKLKYRRSVSLITALLGVIIFIDDYFNCLMIGTVMRPVADKFRVSREKLAYIIDATSAPICILAPISSWAAYVVSCIPKEAADHGMELFLASMPFNFYALGALVLAFALCAFENADFGPMRDAERVTRRGHDVGADRTAAVGLAAVPVVGKGCVLDLVLPICVLIVLSVFAMLCSGGYFTQHISAAHAFAAANAAKALATASFAALLFAFLLFVPRRLIRFKDFSNVVILGMKTMIPAIVMLTLAWTISGVCDELLGTGKFFSKLLVDTHFSMPLLPACFFLLASFLAFATGASWGAIGILVPIAAQTGLLVSNPVGAALLLGSVLSGSVLGDHCSPISDTTILSSTGAGCRHHNHVVTQMPYALLVGALSLVAYVVAGCLLI